MITTLHDGALGGSPSAQAERLSKELPQLAAGVLRDLLLVDRADERRAAAVVAYSIGSGALVAVTCHMDTDEINELSLDLGILGFVAQDEIDATCRRFVDALARPRQLRPTRAELAQQLTERVREVKAAKEEEGRAASSPFPPLEAAQAVGAADMNELEEGAAEPTALAIARELITMSSDEAADVLRGFNRATQQEVIRVISTGEVLASAVAQS